MLDQSFSADNFRKIFDYENRKGVYLAGQFFPKVRNASNELKKCRAALKDLKRPADEEKLQKKKSKLEDKKEKLLTEALEAISSIVTKKDFTIRLDKKVFKGNEMYIPECSTADFSRLRAQKRNKLVAQYFALKQVQRNIRKLYKVKQADRHNIVCQLREFLKEEFPKCIIKTDISGFYENIPRERIIKKINDDNLLSYRSKKIIKQILYEYGKKSAKTKNRHNKKGLPRGIGISAYLSELYMRDFDEAIQNSPNIIYYARYVDDIIVIYKPAPNCDFSKNFFKAIKDKELEKNENKTLTTRVNTDKIIKADPNVKKIRSIDYLGYNFKFQNGNVNVSLTKSKIEKYKKKIDLTFKAYETQLQHNQKKARRLLVKRIKFLTGNTRLIGNKKNIRVGVYFSNKILTNTSCLRGIDSYLANKRMSPLINNETQTRLANLSFETGFEKKTFYKFSKKDLDEIMEAWKYGP